MEFGEKLKQARISAGLTQEDVVRQVGVSRQTVSNWENNRSYPDLASVLKLSDLYGLSLDDLLREDAALRRKIEERQLRVKKYSSWLHDFAMLLIGSNILLTWMDKTALGISLGILGVVLIFAVHFLFVRYLGANWKVMALRSMALAMWSSGYMLRIASHYSSSIGDLLWFGGLALECYVSVRMKFEVQYYKHMTAFTGFVIAAILVFGGVPISSCRFPAILKP